MRAVIDRQTGIVCGHIFRTFFKCFVFLALSLYITSVQGAHQSIVFAVNPTSVTQQEVYHLLAYKFEAQNPDIRIHVVSRSSQAHRQFLKQLVEGKKVKGDVLLGYGGSQLNQLKHAGKLLLIDDIWQQQGLDKQFSAHSKEVVSFQNNIYAIPLNYYQWGIYYKKPVFERLGLTPPNTWQELTSIIRELNANQITPFIMSTGSEWTLGAWFEYLDLRLNGLSFHEKLLHGEISFEDNRVRKVFAFWRELIEMGAFNPKYIHADWRQNLPLFYRDYVAMTLMGNFFVSQVPDPIKDNIGFVAFPIINDDIPRFEAVPTDVAFINVNSNVPQAAQKFLTFLATPETQQQLNGYLGKISANLLVTRNEGDFIQQGKQHIESSAGTAQFFDRETNSEFADQALSVFKSFVLHPQNTDSVVRELEALRKRYLQSESPSS